MTVQGLGHPEADAPSDSDPTTAASGELAAAVRRFQSPLIRYVEQMLPNRPDQAQDIVQITFLQFRKSLVNGTRIRHHATWLYRVAHNFAVDLNRRENRHRELEEELVQDPAATAVTGSSDPDPAVHLGRKEINELAMKELRQLRDEDKQILLLKLFEGMTLQQISTLTGANIGTIHYRLNRGLRTLNQRFRALGVIE